MRDPIDRPCSLLNLANPALSNPPPTLSIMANARREKNNCSMVLRGLWAVNSIPYSCSQMMLASFHFGK
jgi:hypothetical protein